MNAVIAIFGTATFEDNKATFQKVDHVIYMDVDKASQIYGRLIDKGHVDSFVIPSMYEGELILPEGTELPAEFPKDFNWDFIEDYLPDYHHAVEVLESDLLQRYVDNELDDGEEGRQKDIDWVEADCPEYLSKIEWAHHKLAKIDTYLFNRAREHKVGER